MITGSDSLLDGTGRSATGRWLAESLLLPTMMLPEFGAIRQGSRVTLSRFGESATIELNLDETGRPSDFLMQRWGNPGEEPFRYFPFGGVVEEEGRFGGYTIPSRLRIGWHFGTPRWEEGEFFRMTVDEAIFH